MSKKKCCCNPCCNPYGGGYPMPMYGGGYGPGIGGFGGGSSCGGFGGSPCTIAILLLIFQYSGLLCNNKGFLLILLFLLCGCGGFGGNRGGAGFFQPRCC
ncbi:hypothetical protein [Clostridium manihotivorum]|uniref:Uncharacterized protein n=1 Tax=Clostridium manihotivorum TaxID=2320868 RepID=A0A410DYD9_9CLOT|nr:hypothetical protein [Clostridium manihotivorum]QAA34109.1 hypothetical protein C1I91_22140 [Clostridium manihotivorum]